MKGFECSMSFWGATPEELLAAIDAFRKRVDDMKATTVFGENNLMDGQDTTGKRWEYIGSVQKTK